MHVKRNSKTQRCPEFRVAFLKTDPNFKTRRASKPPAGRHTRSLLENAIVSRLKVDPVPNFEVVQTFVLSTQSSPGRLLIFNDGRRCECAVQLHQIKYACCSSTFV